MRLPTIEIVVNGRRKIVNADDPRASNAKAVQEKGREEAVKRRPGRPRKKAD